VLLPLLDGESWVPVPELSVGNIGVQSQLLALLQINLCVVITVSGKNLLLQVIRFMAKAMKTTFSRPAGSIFREEMRPRE
jgi:hypothetical protein